MFQFRDLINAHVSSWAGRAHVLDDMRLPAWLDRRLHMNRKQDLAKLRRVERSGKRPMVGKDAKQDR